MDFGPRLGTTSDSYCSSMQQVQYGQYLKSLRNEILGVIFLSHMKDYLIPRRIQFTTSDYLLSFQSYKGLKWPNERNLRDKELVLSAEFVTSYD